MQHRQHPMSVKQQLAQAYARCGAIARQHYENFPVASLLLPARLRRSVSVIYAFARTADDFADEGDMSAAQRLALLDDYSRSLDAMSQHDQHNDNPVFVALHDVITRHRLSVGHFHDLLTAFRMDVTTKRYAGFSDVLHYCRYSANPVGRLVLQLSGQDDPRNCADSDNICTALQLINFLQDIEQDYTENGRIYLPLDEMARFGVNETDIAQRRRSTALKRLIDHQVNRARSILQAGMPLGARLPGRLGLQIRCTVLGGMRVLEKMASQADSYARPRLGTRDWISIAATAFLRKENAAGN